MRQRTAYYQSRNGKSLWGFLDKGRSLKNGEAFIPKDGEDELIGYWTREEIKVLRDKLKLEIEKSDKKSDKSDNEGFEYVYAALEEINQSSEELIFNVEK